MPRNMKEAHNIFKSAKAELIHLIEQTQKELNKLDPFFHDKKNQESNKLVSIYDEKTRVKFPSIEAKVKFQEAYKDLGTKFKKLNESIKSAEMKKVSIKELFAIVKDTFVLACSIYKTSTIEPLGIGETSREISKIFKNAMKKLDAMEPGFIKKAQKIASLVGTEIKDGAKFTLKELQNSRRHNHAARNI